MLKAMTVVLGTILAGCAAQPYAAAPSSGNDPMVVVAPDPGTTVRPNDIFMAVEHAMESGALAVSAVLADIYGN